MSNSLIKAISLLAAAAIGAALVNAATVDSPDAVVASFNQAITERDMDAAMAHFVPGGVQFNLRPSHGGLETGPLTAELEARWRMIGPVLFSHSLGANFHENRAQQLRRSINRKFL
jgi:hypothetical protein